MSDGSGGIRAVMISSESFAKLLVLKNRLRHQASSQTLEHLIDKSYDLLFGEPPEPRERT